MSEAEETSKSSFKFQSENPATDDPLGTTSFLTIADATTFISRCRDFLEKEKLENQASDESDASDNLLNELTDREISMIHEELFHSWNTIKNENVKVMPTITQLKSWPPRRDQVLEYEETLDSFEEAKATSKMDMVTHSQMASRPLSPDLLDLLESNITVVNTKRSEALAATYDEKAKNEAKDFDQDKNDLKLVIKSRSLSNIPQHEKDKEPNLTTSLLATLKRSASLDLSIRIYEWSEGDLRRRVKLEEKKVLTPSTSKSEDALATSLTSNFRLNKRREFSFWLLNQTRKLYDSIVSEQSEDEASQNTSSSFTKDSSVPETPNKSPILLPPAVEKKQGSSSGSNLSLNVFSDDTLSEVTSILTDSDFVQEKASDQAKGVQAGVNPATSSSSIDSTVSSLDSNRSTNRRREGSPVNSGSSPKRQTV